MENIFSKKNMLILIPATIIGLLTNWTMQVSRIHFDGNYLDGFNAIFSTPGLLIGALPLSVYRSEIMAFLIVTCAASFFLYQRQKNRKIYRSGAEHGSARWGTAADIQPYIAPDFSKNVLLTQTERLMMESRPKNPAHARNKNVLVIGGSGSGKTRFFVKPNIMQMHSSYVITDPKGTVLLEVGQLLQRGKYDIKIFNTVNFAKSMKYNPLLCY